MPSGTETKSRAETLGRTLRTQGPGLIAATLVVALVYLSLRWAIGHRWWTLAIVAFVAGVSYRLAIGLPWLGPLLETWGRETLQRAHQTLWGP